MHPVVTQLANNLTTHTKRATRHGTRGRKASAATLEIRKILEDGFKATGEYPSTSEIARRMTHSATTQRISWVRADFMKRMASADVAHTVEKEQLLRDFLREGKMVFYPKSGIEFHADVQDGSYRMTNVYEKLFPNMENLQLVYEVHGDHEVTFKAALDSGATFDHVDWDPYGCTPFFYKDAHRLLKRGSILSMTYLQWNRGRGKTTPKKFEKLHGISPDRCYGNGLLTHISANIESMGYEVVVRNRGISNKGFLRRAVFYVR